ncbi:MAG: argininosuccinate lyase [Chloroflexota bacterium]|nr:argininosuccinate lyase [Chloroflexota bacterium]
MIELPPGGPGAIDLALLPNLGDFGTLGTITGASVDPAVFDYTASIRFDWKLYRHDIAGSIGHVRMLAEALPEIMPLADARAVEAGLLEVCAEIDQHSYRLVPLGEDIHSHVELRLRQILEVRHPGRGEELGRRLHTARSRNDQVATDVRLWCKDAAVDIARAVLDLQGALLGRARAWPSAVFPGYTHLQPAQPVLFAHHLLAYVEMLARDLDRLERAHLAADVLPLGAAALAGTTFPIRRDIAARELGFAAISANSMDAVSDRDFAVELIAAGALLMAHLSRLSEDLVLWASDEFGLIALSPRWAEGSSIMPQKRNPDAAELTRAKAGRVYGHLIALLTALKGLPMTYGRDLQEDKEALFDAAATARGALRALTVAISSLELRPQRAHVRAGAGYATATDLADHLVRHGVPFRTAHEVVKRLVADCASSQRPLTALTLEELHAYSPHFGPDALLVVHVEHSVTARDVPGGTAPTRVAQALTAAAQRHAAHHATWTTRPTLSPT